MNIAGLANYMMKTSHTVAVSDLECEDCNYSESSTNQCSYYYDLQRSELDIQQTDTIAKIFGRLLSIKIPRPCNECGGIMNKNIRFLSTPNIVIFHILFARVHINKRMRLGDKSLQLRGIVYHGHNHYTCRIIDVDKSVWFHDGITTGKYMSKENSSDNNDSMFFNTCQGREVTLLVYSCGI